MISSTTNGIERLNISGGDTVDKSVTNNCNNSNNVHHDGNYYLEQLNNTRDRLVATADDLDAELEELLKTDTSEEIIGHIRSASGKARLLARQKIKQFEELCHKNLDPPPNDPFPTKIEDLEGFWDMVLLQVDNIDDLFAEINAYRLNGWRIPENIETSQPPSKTPNTRRSVGRLSSKDTVDKTPSPASILAAQKREAQRKKLAEMKRQYKQQHDQQNNGDENNVNNH